MAAILTIIAKRKRLTQSVRLARAARVLRRFDLQTLMLTAQVARREKVRLWVDTHIAAGSLAGPPVRGRRDIDGFEWTVIAPLSEGPRA